MNIGGYKNYECIPPSNKVENKNFTRNFICMTEAINAKNKLEVSGVGAEEEKDGNDARLSIGSEDQLSTKCDINRIDINDQGQTVHQCLSKGLRGTQIALCSFSDCTIPLHVKLIQL